jgi:nicotinate-nucleotide adenylyltransferase
MRGIYGGTFDPVHYGHLRTALEVGEAFALETVALLPSHLPPHRDEPDVSSEQRLRMIEIAIADTPGLTVDRRELDRGGPSYMVDTLASLRAEYPDDALLLFIGADAFAGLERWHRWQALFDHAHLVVMTRPGHSLPAMSPWLAQRRVGHRRALDNQGSGFLYFQVVTALDISATTIRDLIAAGRNPKFLLPDGVIDFIRQHHLYSPINAGQ